MYIIGHCRINCIDFGGCKIYSLFTEVQKRILIHYSSWNQIIISASWYTPKFDRKLQHKKVEKSRFVQVK